MENKENLSLLFVGHLEEIDDLKKWKRNAPLSNTEENQENLNKISDAIANKMRESGKEAVMFVSSPKIRARQTAELVSEEIKRILGKKIKIRYTIEENLDATRQGEFILPEDYRPGSFFEGLKIASKIFLEESLNSSDQNLHYKFGDPVMQPDGAYKYPELAKYFSISGETYAQSLVRIFTSVVHMSQKFNKLNSLVEVVIVAHGFTYQILRGLTILSEQIKQEQVGINTGEIAVKLWEIYNTRTSELRETAYAPLDINNLGDRELLLLLKKEIEYLKK